MKRSLILLLVVVCLIITGCGKSEAEIKEQWKEAKIAVAAIRAAIDVYNAQKLGDLTGLKDMLADGFKQDSPLIKEIQMDDSDLKTLQYFDREDFSMEFINDGTDGEFLIKVDASKGKGGKSGEGPKKGTGSYNSAADEYSGMLK